MPNASFYLGPQNVLTGCEAKGERGTSDDSYGFYSESPGCILHGCLATDCGEGIFWQTGSTASVAVGCAMSNCYIGHRIMSEKSGAVFSTAATCDFDMSSTAKYNIDYANNFDRAKVVHNNNVGCEWGNKHAKVGKKGVSPSSSATPTITVTPATGEFQVAYCTYAGNVALTIAIGAGVFDDMTPMRVIIQAKSGTTITGVTWPASFAGGVTSGVTATWYRMQTFIYNANSGKWVNTDGSTAAAGDYWP